ncbi:hypothetical protein RU07_23690 [Agrobacterium tumefaciens]|uniref:Uncharacterized protein n=1 Tax=Agrobacterium tumefaciens TaxID=358 RepID=A0A0D0KKZ8_AGRTU|nr:hypothetical protein RU07_23690 [Agrobacterium tumefaciens]
MGTDALLTNLTIDSKLRACDLVKPRVEDLWSGSSIRQRDTIVQNKTTRVMQFEDKSRLKSHLRHFLPLFEGLAAASAQS